MVLSFRNRVQWARFYLTKTGHIDSSTRGVWAITEKGRQASISGDAVQSLIRQVNAIAGRRQEQADEDITTETDADYRSKLLEILYNISPAGFERFCQRLLRESGFEQVVVTGRSGDGGIDGHGVLQLNPFVSFRVLFQCKRYRQSVGAPAIRDFRGAMMGRADKGIIMTTGSFTPDASREAMRDGVPPIELVDGESLITMFESLEFGLLPVQSFEVDEEFFQQFRE